MFTEKEDRERGIAMSVAWLQKRLENLLRQLEKGTHDQRVHEFGDVIAWVFSLANQVGVDVEQALDRYVTNPPKIYLTKQ